MFWCRRLCVVEHWPGPMAARRPEVQLALELEPTYSSAAQTERLACNRYPFKNRLALKSRTALRISRYVRPARPYVSAGRQFQRREGSFTTCPSIAAGCFMCLKNEFSAKQALRFR